LATPAFPPIAGTTPFPPSLGLNTTTLNPQGALVITGKAPTYAINCILILIDLKNPDLALNPPYPVAVSIGGYVNAQKPPSAAPVC